MQTHQLIVKILLSLQTTHVNLYHNPNKNEAFLMSRLLLLVIFQISILLLSAQPTPQEEILGNPNLSASNSVAYPSHQTKLTPAPKGMKPFYLSHYGRHGSRYLTKKEEYNYVPRILKEAEKLGKLTKLGIDVLKRALYIREKTTGHCGDLTPLGAQQHRDIARRMTENFPELFRRNATVDARSTVVSRCILSMGNAILQLKAYNPRLKIRKTASGHENYFMYHQDKKLRAKNRPDTLIKAYNKFCEDHWAHDRLMNSLFNDPAYIRDSIDIKELHLRLFRLAGILQNTELADSVSLYDIFTPNEIYNNWLTANVWWYLGYGFTSLNGGTQPFVQRNLLRKMIADADSCIQLKETNVQLRFGHDTILLPLVCLMGINGYDKQVDNLDSLAASGWIDYRVFPMAGNLQLVFYRRNAKDREPLLKVLLNEQEATLPIPAYQGPYYRWADVKKYMLRRLSTYSE